MKRCLFILGFAASLASLSAAAQELVLVAGATGRTGRLIVDALLDKGYAVRAVSRSAERAAGVGEGVDGVAADVTKPETLGTVMEGADIAISAVGGRWPIGENGFRAVDWEGNRALIDAAKNAGVEQFLLITAGSAGRDGFMYTLPLAPYPWKGKAEAHLRASGLTYTILGPGGLTDGPGGQAGVRLASRESYESGMVTRADVAAVTVAAVGNENAFNKTITIVNDDTLSPDEWRAAFAALPADE